MRGREVTRLEGFSDAVFGIALTNGYRNGRARAQVKASLV